MKTEQLCSESIKKSLKSCKNVTLEIIEELLKLEEQIGRHNGRVLTAKTSGTTVTALGTGLAVTGLIMAPFTLGTSLILSSVGAVTSVTGAAANLITDLVDRSKRNKFIENIHTLSTDQQDSKSELETLLETLNEIMEPLMEKGLTETQALFAALKGDRCSDLNSCKDPKNDQEFEWIQTPDGKWKPIRKFCFKAGLNSLKLVKNTRALTTLAGGGARALSGGASAGKILDVGTRTATATASGGMLTRVGHFLGSAAFRGTMAAVGVVFTSIDIAILVKEWKSTNPTSEAIQVVINELKEEVEEYEKLKTKLDEVDDCKMFVAWISDIPIVATSPFAAEALSGICQQDFVKVNDLYGEIPHQTSKDSTLTALSVLYSHKLTIETSFDDVREKITKVSENMNECLDPAEPVLYLKDVLDKMSSSHEDSMGIRVFNNDVLNLNRDIIEAFLDQGGHPCFDKIYKSLQGTSILKDIENPLPSNVVHSIEKVLVSYKSGGYLNGNKWEYDVTLDLLKEYAGAYFMEEYLKLETNEDDEGLSPSSSVSIQLSDLVEVLVNHKSFLDPLAAAIWTEGNEDKNIFETSFNSIVKLFRDFQFKIPLWACEIHGALNKCPSI